MLSRIHAICSEKEDKNLEIEKLKHLLAKNEYPKEVVEKEVERCLASKERISSACSLVGCASDFDAVVCGVES